MGYILIISGDLCGGFALPLIIVGVVTARLRLIAGQAPPEQAFSAQVFIDIRPVDAISSATNFPIRPLFGRGSGEAGIPDRRH